MIRIFTTEEGQVVNVDNNADASRLIKSGANELSSEEITEVFGELAHMAGPHNTTILDDGSVSFTAPTEDDLLDAQWATVRAEREPLLFNADLICNIAQDAGSDEDKRLAASYRQALRDVTDQLDPFGIVWPTLP